MYIVLFKGFQGFCQNVEYYFYICKYTWVQCYLLLVYTYIVHDWYCTNCWWTANLQCIHYTCTVNQQLTIFCVFTYHTCTNCTVYSTMDVKSMTMWNLLRNSTCTYMYMYMYMYIHVHVHVHTYMYMYSIVCIDHVTCLHFAWALEYQDDFSTRQKCVYLYEEFVHFVLINPNNIKNLFNF